MHELKLLLDKCQETYQRIQEWRDVPDAFDLESDRMYVHDLVQDIQDEARKLGCVIESIHDPNVGRALNVVAAIISWCKCQGGQHTNLVESDSTNETGWLDMERAANYLGYSVDGLRKLVDSARKGEIPLRLSQPVPGGKILFRREWLDEFLEKSMNKPAVKAAEDSMAERKCKTRETKPPKTDETSHGLDWSLLK